MNDEEQNLSGEEPTEPQPTAEPRPKRLLRSTEDRMIWGVAGGLGRYFDIDPIIFRIAFGVSILFGGLGLLTYAAFALFVPVGDGHEVQPAVFKRSRWPVIVAGIAVALIVLPVLACLAVFVTATGHGVWAAVVVAILGVVLLATSVAGGARWLIIPAAVLAVAIGGTAAADIRFLPVSASASTARQAPPRFRRTDMGSALAVCWSTCATSTGARMSSSSSTSTSGSARPTSSSRSRSAWRRMPTPALASCRSQAAAAMASTSTAMSTSARPRGRC